MIYRIINLGKPFVLRLIKDEPTIISAAGQILYVNDSTAAIIKKLESGKSVSAIAHGMSEEYNVDVNIIKEDIACILSNLNRYGLCTNVEVK